MVISIKSLSGGYGKHHVIHDVDFEAKNELTVIVGANGSGKSTLLKSICGLCDVYDGSVKFHEKELKGIPTYKIARMGISYMAQRENVFAELSVYENLVTASIPDDPDLDRTFEMFPMLSEFKSRKARTLSGGQRQLLAMAMIAQKNPPVILFDEPTAALSPKNATSVLEKIQEIQKKLNNCVILVEQNVKSALALCNSCYLLADGKVIHSGDANELLQDSDLGVKYLGLNKQ